MNESQKAAGEKLSELMRGYVVTQIIATATRLRIPDYVGTREVGIDELSQLTNVERGSYAGILCLMP